MILATPWISRTAAVLILVGVVAAMWLWVAEPLWRAYAEGKEAISEAGELLQRYERLAAARPTLEAEVRASGQVGASDAYLAGETDGLAAAALQSRVASLMSASGAVLNSIQVLPAREEAGLRRVTLRVQMSAAIEPLVKILYALETEKPVLFVDNLDIQGRQQLHQLAATGGALITEPLLMVSFDLYGFVSGMPAGPQ